MTWPCCATAGWVGSFARAYPPSTLGSLLRTFTFGHVRRLDAVASRFLCGLAVRSPVVAGIEGSVLIDIDDTIIEVHGHTKQGSGYRYRGVRGLNALLGTVTTADAAPVIVAQRLGKGSCGSPRGAKRIVADPLAAVTRLPGPEATGTPLVRMDSAFYRRPAVLTALRAGAQVSVTVRSDPKVKAAISAIGEDAWTAIEYTDAVFDEDSGRWISRAEVAEVPFTAFTCAPKPDQVLGRLVVRRIPDLNPKTPHGQGELFDPWRFHAFFTTSTLDTVTADKTHRAHAIIEAVHADLKASALAHLPSAFFRRELRLAGAGRDGVQPDPVRRDHHRAGPGQGHHCHHPAQTDRRSRPGRHLRPPRDPAPAHRLAVGERLDRAGHPRLRTTHARHTPTHPGHRRERTTGHPGAEAGQSPTHAPPDAG
jgi:hypothetical protein